MRRCTRRGRPLPGVIIPPGVDVDRFRPIPEAERVAVRLRFGLDPDRPFVLGTSRLVPRKGFDVLIDAMAHVRPDAQLVIAGEGRDRTRLEHRAERARAPAGSGSRDGFPTTTSRPSPRAPTCS